MHHAVKAWCIVSTSGRFATEYTIAINLLHDSIWGYLTQETSLETALDSYRSQLAERLNSK